MHEVFALAVNCTHVLFGVGFICKFVILNVRTRQRSRMRSNCGVFHFAPFMGRRAYIAREIAHHLLPRGRAVGRRDAARARLVVV